MIALLAIPLMLLSDLSVRVAPERALPITYQDEPVIVQINDAQPGAHDISGTVTNAQGETIELHFPHLTFPDSTPYYITLPDTLTSFGPHTLKLHLDDTPKSATTTFYRNRRPDPKAPKSIYMTFPNWQSDSYTIALESPLKEARIYLHSDNAQEAITQLSSLNIDMRAVVTNADLPTTAAQLETWITTHATTIGTWEFDLDETPKQTLALTQLLHQLKPNAQISIRPKSPEALQAFMSANTTPIRDIVLTNTTDNLEVYRIITQLSGLESPSFSLEFTQPNTGANWAQLTDPIATLTPMTLSVSPIDTKTTEGLSALSQINFWAPILSDYEAIGPYHIQEGIQAHLYRAITPDKPWLMAVTATEAQSIDLPEALQSFTLLSHFQVALPQSQPTSIALSITPIFLSSTDTTPIAQVVCNALNLHAAVLLTNDAYTKALPTTIKNTIDQLAKTSTENTFRSAFLNLVRQFPELEEQYATGQLDQEIAIPLIAQLAHITRLIATLEQYTGEPFLESPSTTLAQCNNFLADYLSRGLPQVPHSREAQLLAEINRLITEAQALDTRGLTIEATAVATLAEWRARALLKRAEIQQSN